MITIIDIYWVNRGGKKVDGKWENNEEKTKQKEKEEKKIKSYMKNDGDKNYCQVQLILSNNLMPPYNVSFSSNNLQLQVNI